MALPSTLQSQLYRRALNLQALEEVAPGLPQLKPAAIGLGKSDPVVRMLTLNSVQQHWGFSTWV